jgi:ssDNA-specific exonuclease RecJ
VLEELGLIRTTGQEIVLEKTQEKRNLADSRTYQRLIEAQRQWAFLTDESLPRIRDYLFNLNGGITP